MANSILELDKITKTYPGVVALDEVSMQFDRGEVHAIVGENGAGKSTLIKAVSGAITPDSGTITIDGCIFHKLTPEEAIKAGVAVIYQEFNLFESLSAAENIFIGEKFANSKIVNFKAMNKKALELFNRFNVNINPKTLIRELSPAQKQIVEVAHAIHKNVKIMIMDEPTAPLTVGEVEKLYDTIRELKKNGITIIYISHRMDEIFTIADRVSVMRDGKYVATKNVKDTCRKDLISLMVGRELKGGYPESAVKAGETALEVRGLTGNGVSDISFSVRKGEILGVAGLVGAGRTELMRVIFGADKIQKGEVLLNGKPMKIKSPADALDKGIGLIPEDRKLHGVFLPMSIEWNICISNIKSISKSGVVDRKKEKRQAEYYRDVMRIKTPSLRQQVVNLSGGNQQKVVMAKVLAAKTDVLIFDEPTRGIDVGAREEIYQLMRELSNDGKAVIMVSSDMEELLGMSDRIIVMSEGTLKGELNKGEFNQQHILDLASCN